MVYVSELSQELLGPVVHLCLSDWLLLQTPRLVFQEPEPILLRCHSWKNKSLYKIIFFQDGKPRKFSHMNSSFSIPRANVSHSGTYHCTGVIGQMRHSSRPMAIAVRGGNRSSSRSFRPWKDGLEGDCWCFFRLQYLSSPEGSL